jgi:mannose-6-phosphate isomerase-like protein (cupin superfamily)
MQHLTEAARFTASADAPNEFVEHLRAATMSVGTYSIPAGGLDDQTPHAEDEVYVVLAGRGLFTGGDQTVPVGPGSTLFVPADEDHRFHDVSEDLAVLVIFAPPYTGRG